MPPPPLQDGCCPGWVLRARLRSAGSGAVHAPFWSEQVNDGRAIGLLAHDGHGARAGRPPWQQRSGRRPEPQAHLHRGCAGVKHLVEAVGSPSQNARRGLVPVVLGQAHPVYQRSAAAATPACLHCSPTKRNGSGAVGRSRHTTSSAASASSGLLLRRSAAARCALESMRRPIHGGGAACRAAAAQLPPCQTTACWLRQWLSLDEAGHSGDGEGDHAMRWGVDEALGDEARPSRAEAAAGASKPGGNLTRGASPVAVRRHCAEVSLFRSGCAVPTRPEEAVIQRASAFGCTQASVRQGDSRARRIVPGVLPELLQEVGVAGSLLDYQGHGVSVPSHPLGCGWLGQGLAGELPTEVFDAFKDEQPLGVRLRLCKHAGETGQSGQCEKERHPFWPEAWAVEHTAVSSA